MRVTKHGERRVRKRFGVPRKAVIGVAQTALSCGLRHREARGKLRRYLDGVFLREGKADNLRVYAGYVFVFTGDTLLTVWRVPPGVTR